MAVEWCAPCKARGRLSIAVREITGTPMCDECIAGKPSNGVRTELAAEVLKERKKEKTMPKRIDDATRAAIRADAAGGLSIDVIRKKHHVGWGTAQAIVANADTKIPRVERGGKPAARRGRPPKSAAKSANGGGVTLNATAELCDGIWAALPLEKKAALLNRLAEVN